MPFCLLLIQLGWPLFVNAWESNEMSQNAGGLIRWPVFLLIPLGMTLLLVQALSELIKRIAFLRGLIPDPLAHAAPEEETVDQLEGRE
jgi:TRAP-type mannitol/chloroaromatic compound transport system permease small subunit